VAVIGSDRDDEWSDAGGWLQAQSDVDLREFSGELNQFLSGREHNDWHPDLLVFCEKSPGEFAANCIDDALSRHPLIRILCLQDYWSESAGRTDPVWPEAARISTRAAIPRLALELDVIQGRCGPLPLTAGRDELFEFMQQPATRFPIRDCRVHVESTDVAWRETVLAWFAQKTTDTGIARIEAIIADLDPWSAESLARLQRLRAQAPEIPIVGVGHWLPNRHPEQLSSVLDAVVARLSPLWYLQSVVGTLSDAT